MINKRLKTLHLFLWLCIFSLGPALIQAQNLKENAAVDSLEVGDTFDFSIILNRDQEYDEINFPDSTHLGDTFEIRSRKQFKVSAFKDSVHYKIQFFGTSDTTFPQLPVQLIQNQDTTVLYTNPIPIHFNTVLAKGEKNFRPLKPIFDFAAAWWPYILGLIILAVAAYLAYNYYIKQKEVEEEKPRATFTATPFVNPLKEFKQTIKKLENAELAEQKDFKAFYIALGDAIRQYYESLYDLPALESTSRELLTMLNNHAVDQDLITDTKAVLQEADMVKFAKFKPTQAQADRALKKAYNFLERARKIDGPRIEHLRRKHQTQVETDRQRFYEEQEKAEEVKA